MIMTALSANLFASVVLKAPGILIVLLQVVFFLPVVFQIFTGLKALNGKINVKYWAICVVSIVSQILATFSIMWLMHHNMQQSGIRNGGLGFLFVELIGLLMIVQILIVIGAQLIIKNNR